MTSFFPQAVLSVLMNISGWPWEERFPWARRMVTSWGELPIRLTGMAMVL